MADGTKLKSFIVFKGVRPMAELQKANRVVVASRKKKIAELERKATLQLEMSMLPARFCACSW